MLPMSELDDLPRAPLEQESALCERLGLTPASVCILFQDAQSAVLAIESQINVTHAQLQLAWQQLFSSHLITIPLRRRNNYQISTTESVAVILQKLVTYALATNASDIHLEPLQQSLRIRLRVAGQLITLQHLSSVLGRQLVAHIKVAADLDISDVRKPQDGRFSIAISTEQHSTPSPQDFRVSTCAMLNGEKLVMRCLGRLEQIQAVTQLGLSERQLHYTSVALTMVQGLILVTGPTGSGKTSTLYSLLQRLNQQARNICTVEDPIEIRCQGINQVPVRHQWQLGFADILRSLLRQDPDVLMVGEIRDSETANVALQAAQTGHLVLASLHTNGAAASFNRLHALGVASAEVSSALSLIISQRLLRKLCNRCQGKGCSNCHDGYFGQIACFEVVPWSNSVATQLDSAALNKRLTQLQLPTLLEHAESLVKQGLTSSQQAARLVHASA